MKKPIHLAFLTLLLPSWMGAQTTTHNISLGASYAQAEFYNLDNNATQSVAHSTWDIAFGVANQGSAGIFVNEGTAFSGTTTKVYAVPNKNFTDVITTGDFGDELFNPEQSWDVGAFNTISTGSPLDLGWGMYNTMTHQVVGGSKVYAITLKDGSHKKMMITSLSAGVYDFQYADLNGSNLQRKTIDKANFSGKTLAYFSFATGNTVTAEVAGWDWVFTRYQTDLYTTNPPTPYMVGGLLLNEGVEAVMADNVNPATVNHQNYTTSNDSLTLIGHNWKFFDFSNGWAVEPNRVYFVKTNDNNLYQIEFLSFQGSSTGQGMFAKTYLGRIVGLDLSAHTELAAVECYPNPATDHINVVYSLRQNLQTARVTLTDMMGRIVLDRELEATNQGMNVATLPLLDVPSGTYALTVQTAADQFTQKVIVTRR